jgi:hypothetical protein
VRSILSRAAFLAAGLLVVAYGFCPCALARALAADAEHEQACCCRCAARTADGAPGRETPGDSIPGHRPEDCDRCTTGGCARQVQVPGERVALADDLTTAIAVDVLVRTPGDEPDASGDWSAETGPPREAVKALESVVLRM